LPKLHLVGSLYSIGHRILAYVQARGWEEAIVRPPLAPGSNGRQIRTKINILNGKTYSQHCTMLNY